MKRIIKKHIDEKKNGLFLLDANTGSGKTTAVLNYMSESIANNPSEKILFITNLKTNLPHERFKKLINEPEFKEYCLILKPFWEMVVDNLLKVSVPDDVKNNCIEYKQLIRVIKKYQFLLKQSDKNYDLINYTKEKIENQFEPNFRAYIKERIIKVTSANFRLSNFNANKWIGEIYESANLEKYKIIFMSTQKFLSPTDRIYKTAITPYIDSNFLKDKTIFIDEFDSCKKVFLNKIIDDGLESKINIFNLFLNIYYNLKNLEIPKVFDDIDEFVSLKTPGGMKIKEILNSNIDLFSTIYEKENMSFLYKTYFEKTDSAFIFKDNFNLTISKINDNVLLVNELDEEVKHNKVSFMKNNGENNFRKHITDELGLKLVEELVDQITHAINHFTKALSWISKRYYNYKIAKENEKEYLYTKLEAIYSVLNMLNLGSDNNKYLVQNIIKLIEIEKIETAYDKNEDDLEDELTVDTYKLKNGIKYLEILDSESHDFQSLINLYKFTDTPEKMLYHIASNARVIGISATATLPTVVNNFDINYLKKLLGDSFRVMDSADYAIVKENKNKREEMINNDKSNIDINVDIIKYDSYGDVNDSLETVKSLLKEIALEKNISDELYNEITRVKNDNYYYYIQMLKIILIFKKFSNLTYAKSFIAFLNSIPREDVDRENSLDSSLLKTYFEIIDKDINVFYISASNYDYQMDMVREDLSVGKKCFVITTYQTIGTGKNIQYKIPNSEIDNVIVADTEYMEKDFDGIYLMKPTNITQRITTNSEHKYRDLTTFLFQIEYIYANQHIDNRKFIEGVKKAFRAQHINNPYPVSLPVTIDNDFNIAGIIIQAVGRICRCANKNKNTFIYVDSYIVDHLKTLKDYFSNKILNQEFLEILNYNYEKVNLDNVDNEKYIDSNLHSSSLIKQLLLTLRTKEESRKAWRDVGDYILKHPTALEVEKDFSLYYVKLEQPAKAIYYKGYYANPKHFTTIKKDGYSSVSLDLLDLEKLPQSILCSFKDLGYATKFLEGNYILTPVSFVQLYKGRLGEALGKIILKQYCGIDLLDLPSESFEIFDYLSEDNIYIDFKNWKYIYKSNNEYVSKIQDKLKSVPGKIVLIINVFEDESYIDSSFDADFMSSIFQIPALLDSNLQIIQKNIDLINNIYLNNAKLQNDYSNRISEFINDYQSQKISSNKIYELKGKVEKVAFTRTALRFTFVDDENSINCTYYCDIKKEESLDITKLSEYNYATFTGSIQKSEHGIWFKVKKIISIK